MKNTVIFVCVLSCISLVQAAITVEDLGIGAPPAQLGTGLVYNMVPFANDARPTNWDVTSVPAPSGSALLFQNSAGDPQNMEHENISDGTWATWSHSYAGDVYSTKTATSVDINLPDKTGAFYFYVESYQFGLYDFQVSVLDDQYQLLRSIITLDDVEGNGGARGLGIYSDDGTDAFRIIRIESLVRFGVGEFGIATVPVPGALMLGALGSTLVAFMRRKRIR